MTGIIDVSVGHSLRNIYGQALIALAPYYQFDVLDADVAGGVGLSGFRDAYRDRFVQCGISEQAMVGMAAGMALAGNSPVLCNTFATFGLRALEIFRLSVAGNNANVKLVMSHVGLDVGPDGGSCQELSYYGIWRTIPNVTVIHPATSRQMFEATKWMLETPGPVVMFTGRSEISSTLPDIGFRICQPDKIQRGERLTIVTAGNILGEVVKAADGLNVDVFVLSTIAPIAGQEFDTIANSIVRTGRLLTVEDGNPVGGIAEIITSNITGASYQHLPLGVEGWGESGEGPELWQKHGLDASSIREQIERWCNE